MDWFEDWFDSPYYHLLYKNRDEEEAELFVNKLISKLKLKKNSRLIDIACGTGRHSTYFHKKGMKVVGIDLSKNSISKAKIFESNSLVFKVHDMRRVYKKNYFDIATNLFTSFGYFENQNDNLQTMNSMSENLKKDGILIIDFMNVKKVISGLIRNEEKEIKGVLFKIRRKIERGYIIKDITITDGPTKKRFQEKVQTLTLSTFNKLINNSKLKIIDIFGNYKLEEFNALNSDRLILICKK